MVSSSFRIGQLDKKTSTKTIRQCLERIRHEACRELVFCRVDLNERVLPELEALLCHARYASLKFIQCTGTGLAKVMTDICHFNACKSLVLSGNVQVAALEALLQGLRTNQSIRTLKLLGVNLSTLANANDLFDELRHNCTLQHLDLSRCQLQGPCPNASAATVAAVGRALQTLPWKSLSLAECRLSDESLATLVRHVPVATLQSLNVSHNSVQHQTLAAMQRLLHNQHGSLEVLNVSYSTVTTDAAAESDSPALTAALHQTLAALRHNHTLRCLDVSGTPAVWQSTVAMQGLMDCLQVNTTLQEVHLADCNITAQGIAVVAAGLAHCNVQDLNILHEGNASVDSTMQDMFLQALQRNTTVMSLGPQAQGALAHALNVNRAGRRALQTSNNTMPTGLWSTILTKSVQEDNTDGLFGLLRQGALLGR